MSEPPAGMAAYKKSLTISQNLTGKLYITKGTNY